MEITRIKRTDGDELDGLEMQNALGLAAQKNGFKIWIKWMTKTHLRVSGIRLTTDWVKAHGYNVSPYTGGRGRILGWWDWVRFNRTINRVLDELKISANVHSLHGRFKVREGMEKKDLKDWEVMSADNVGSIMAPICRKDAWKNEKGEVNDTPDR